MACVFWLLSKHFCNVRTDSRLPPTQKLRISSGSTRFHEQRFSPFCGFHQCVFKSCLTLPSSSSYYTENFMKLVPLKTHVGTLEFVFLGSLKPSRRKRCFYFVKVQIHLINFIDSFLLSLLCVYVCLCLCMPCLWYL